MKFLRVLEFHQVTLTVGCWSHFCDMLEDSSQLQVRAGLSITYEPRFDYLMHLVLFRV